MAAIAPRSPSEARRTTQCSAGNGVALHFVDEALTAEAEQTGGLLLVIPTAVGVPLGVICGVRALRRQQRLLGGIAIGLCGLATVALMILLILNARSINI